jgi:glycosyltransferase involved in cell wall biosynthesis
MKNPQILVSIICTAYNQQQYIGDALEGFLKQKTDFAFEVFVHDDASTDGTATIIQSYATAYPNIIIPTIQSENQYSQGVNIMNSILAPMARGRYLAICEGDDYWIDPDKLQKQIDYLEAHERCTLSFTNALVDYNGGKQEKNRTVIPWRKYAKAYYDPMKTEYGLIDLVVLDFIPTASLVVRKDLCLTMPELSSECFQGDQYIWLFNTSLGYAHYISECTCAYRRNVVGSVTYGWGRMKREDTNMHPVDKRFLALYDAFDRITDFQFTKELELPRVIHSFEYAIRVHDRAFLRKPLVKDFAYKSGMKALIKYYLAFSPHLYTLTIWFYQKLTPRVLE